MLLLYGMTSYSLEKLCLFLLFIVWSNQVVSQGVTFERGVTYSASGEKLDVCKPVANVRQTAIIFIHGGGFTRGDRSEMLGSCELFAQGGFTGVSIDYRLTSEGFAYPAALNDTNDAIQWMQSNAARLGFNANKVVVFGYSAGATLALTAGLSNNSGVAAIVNIAGITDFVTARSDTSFQQLRDDIDAYVGTAGLTEPSPINRVSDNDPPVLLIHGMSDQIVPISQSNQLVESLKQTRVGYVFKKYANIGHEIYLPNPRIADVLLDITVFLVNIDQGLKISSPNPEAVIPSIPLLLD